MRKTLFCGALGFLLAVGSLAQAAITITSATGPNETFSASSTDLADASQGGSIESSTTAFFGSAPGKLIDGGVYNGSSFDDTAEAFLPAPFSGEVVIDLAGGGRDIASVVVLTGVGSGQGSRVDQGFSLSFRPVGGEFGPNLIQVNLDGDGELSELQVAIFDDAGGLLGTNIEAIRLGFTIGAGDPDVNMYREVDVREALLPGDFDWDDSVDGADFLRWQRGQSLSPLSSSDLDDWENGFGAGGSTLSTLVTVPEPSGLTLLGLVLGLTFLWTGGPNKRGNASEG